MEGANHRPILMIATCRAGEAEQLGVDCLVGTEALLLQPLTMTESED